MPQNNFKACLNCQNRHLNCHSVCLKYLEEVENNKKYLKENLKNNEISSTIITNKAQRYKNISYGGVKLLKMK